MGTLIKLKAEVENNNLPVLGSDGKITDYYVGRLRNKIMELGGTVTDAEVNALTALIENGRTNGWLDKTAYLLPFIGSRDVPFAGAVPLVDKYGDWDMSEYANTNEVTENLFAYDSNNRIKSLGYVESISTSYLKTPVKASELGNSLGTFASFTLYKVEGKEMPFTTLYGANGAGNVFATFRISTYSVLGLNTYYDNVNRNIENVNSIDDGTDINFYAALYPQGEGSETQGMLAKAWFVEGETPKISIPPVHWNVFDGITAPNADAKIYVGRDAIYKVGNTFMPIKCLALITPDITKNEVIALNAAVNTFNTALGR